jgi:hypothetical protein
MRGAGRHSRRAAQIGGTKVTTPHGFPPVSRADRCSDASTDRDDRELSGSSTNRNDPHGWPAFEPTQYLTIAQSVKTSDESRRTGNWPQVSLPERAQIQSGSHKTLVDSRRTSLVPFANETMDASFQGGRSFVRGKDRSGRLLSDRLEAIRQHLAKYPFTSAKQLAKHFCASVPTISRILEVHLGLRKFS